MTLLRLLSSTLYLQTVDLHNCKRFVLLVRLVLAVLADTPTFHAAANTEGSYHVNAAVQTKVKPLAAGIITLTLNA